jgi:hypothetical protein
MIIHRKGAGVVQGCTAYEAEDAKDAKKNTRIFSGKTFALFASLR